MRTFSWTRVVCFLIPLLSQAPADAGDHIKFSNPRKVCAALVTQAFNVTDDRQTLIALSELTVFRTLRLKASIGSALYNPIWIESPSIVDVRDKEDVAGRIRGIEEEYRLNSLGKKSFVFARSYSGMAAIHTYFASLNMQLELISKQLVEDAKYQELIAIRQRGMNHAGILTALSAILYFVSASKGVEFNEMLIIAPLLVLFASSAIEYFSTTLRQDQTFHESRLLAERFLQNGFDWAYTGMDYTLARSVVAELASGKSFADSLANQIYMDTIGPFQKAVRDAFVRLNYKKGFLKELLEDESPVHVSVDRLFYRNGIEPRMIVVTRIRNEPEP